MWTVLMTGAGAPGGIGTLKCLKRDKNIRLFVGDANPTANGRFLNKSRFLTLKKATDPDFIPNILEMCIHHKIQVILPLVTLELFKFAENKALFEENGIKIIVSDKKYLDIANNKSRLYEHLTEHHILTPQYKVVQSGDLDGFLKTFADLGFPENPLCVKPSVSNGSRGVRIVDDSVDKFDLLFNHKPNSLYISFAEIVEILRGKANAPQPPKGELLTGELPLWGSGGCFPELLVSEVLPYEEYTVDTIVNHGKPIVILPRLRKKTNNGISVEGQFLENQEVIDYCFNIITSLNLHGPIGIQVKKAEDGRFKILEINPRIQGTSVAAMGLGINLPLIAVKQEMNKPFEIPPIRWGTSFSRYYQEVFY